MITEAQGEESTDQDLVEGVGGPAQNRDLGHGKLIWEKY